MTHTYLTTLPDYPSLSRSLFEPNENTSNVQHQLSMATPHTNCCNVFISVQQVLWRCGKERKKKPYQDNDFILAACSLQTCNVKCAFEQTSSRCDLGFLCSFRLVFVAVVVVVVVVVVILFRVSLLLCFFSWHVLASSKTSFNSISETNEKWAKIYKKVVRFYWRIKRLELNRIWSNELRRMNGKQMLLFSLQIFCNEWHLSSALHSLSLSISF